jgi:aminoglycoside phosphotransferase (APT) family kinase protein
MTFAASPGRLIGSGRAADVYELDAHRVLRRYRNPFDVGAEAAVMAHLRAAGYPVPEVFDAQGSDLVMTRLHGTDMLADLARKPWLAARHGRKLAQLHDQLHEIEAPPVLRRPFGEGDRVLHLDLHPGNVMLTTDGPVVIDWSNAAAGPPGADVAIAALIMRVSEVDELPLPVRTVASLVRRRLVRRFESSASADIGPYLAEAARLRIGDRNTRPAEAERLRQMLDDHEGRRADRL